MNKNLVVLLGIGLIILISGCVQESGQPGGTQTPSCTPDWQCSDWSECSRTGITSGVQKRTCTDVNECNTTVGKPVESQSCSLPPITIKEPSELILQLEDFPEDKNWTLQLRAERAKSDVSEDAITWGWEGGYEVSYYRIGSLFDTTRVGQKISIYPLENITKVLGITSQWFLNVSNTTFSDLTYDELSKPNIGDDSIAYRIKWKDEQDTEHRGYVIEFIKMNVYEYLELTGFTLDYELLKELTQNAESKIS